MTQPLIAPDVATKLLDEVIYERVLSFVDLDGLYNFEQELWLAVGEADIPEDEIPDRVKSLIDAALRRLVDEPRRYMAFGPPLGMHSNASPFGECEICAAEERINAPNRTKRAARS